MRGAADTIDNAFSVMKLAAGKAKEGRRACEVGGGMGLQCEFLRRRGPSDHPVIAFGHEEKNGLGAHCRSFPGKLAHVRRPGLEKAQSLGCGLFDHGSHLYGYVQNSLAPAKFHAPQGPQ